MLKETAEQLIPAQKIGDCLMIIDAFEVRFWIALLAPLMGVVFVIYLKKKKPHLIKPAVYFSLGIIACIVTLELMKFFRVGQ